MKKELAKNSLRLTTETIRTLTPERLLDVAGGSADTRTIYCTRSYVGTCMKTQ